MTRSLRLLVLPAKPFPCNHAMLDSVLASILPDRGHHVEWVMASSDGRRGRSAWRDTEVHTTPAGSGGPVARAHANVELMRAALDRGRRGGFDVVLVRNAVRLAFVAIWLRRTTGARFVFQFSFPVAERTMVLAGRRPGVSWIRLISAAMSIRARRWVLGLADLVLAVSERMRRDLMLAGIPGDRIVVLPLGANLADPSTDEIDAARAHMGVCADPVVLYVGAIAPERQLDVLVRAAADVHTRHPDAQWVLVGPGPSDEAVRLRRLADEAGLGGAFRVLEPIARHDVAAFLAAAAVSVSPIPSTSLFEVASPTKVAESLAVGTPVVVTPIEDQARTIEASGGGIVAGEDAASFADAVASLLDNPARAREMGARGRAWLAEHRTWTQQAELLESRLVRLVGAAG